MMMCSFSSQNNSKRSITPIFHSRVQSAIRAGALLFSRLGLWEAWEEGSIQVLGHEGFHVFRGLGGGKSLEEEL